MVSFAFQTSLVLFLTPLLSLVHLWLAHCVLVHYLCVHLGVKEEILGKAQTPKQKGDARCIQHFLKMPEMPLLLSSLKNWVHNDFCCGASFSCVSLFRAIFSCDRWASVKVKGLVFNVTVVCSTLAANEIRISASLLGVCEWADP